MGRTLATFTQLIDQEIAAWQSFRRALRKEDQGHLDALFRAAKYHVAAGSYASKSSPFETMIVAMLIESYKKNALLEARVARLEAFFIERKA
ncbi:MAG: hypothetical protein WAO55_08440 [Candidatus Manganitrophaceae bacterium]